MNRTAIKYTQGWGVGAKETQNCDEVAVFHKVLFKTNTKIPISFYTSGKIVKNVHIPYENENKISYIVVETQHPISCVEMREFLQKKKGCNVYAIYPIENMNTYNKYSKEERFLPISEVYRKQRNYDLTVQVHPPPTKLIASAETDVCFYTGKQRQKQGEKK